MAVIAAVFFGLVLIFGRLGGDRLNGDEHNAIVFLKDGLWEYIKTFHYSDIIKLQFWLSHALFGNDFFWYRMPAALAAGATLLWLALYRMEGFARGGVGRAAAVLLVAGNAAFLGFARWGMPIYTETILACSLLMGVVLRDVMRGRMPRWTAFRLLLIVLLPWLYPATVLLLGGITAYLLLFVAVRWWREGRAATTVKAWLYALTPLLLGAVSAALYRLSVPDAHWNRARIRHKAFKAWVENGEGGAGAFVWDSMAKVGGEFLRAPVLADGAKLAWVPQAYAWFVLALAASTLVAIALAARRVLRKGHAALPREAGLLRGAAFLATIVLSILAVTNVAALLDAFPKISLRHLFFVITAPALLVSLALAYLGVLCAQAARRAEADWTIPASRALGLAAIVALGGALALAAVEQRKLEARKYQEMLSILHSPANGIVFSWAPGFYFANATLPASAQFFGMDRGENIPGALEKAIRQRQAAGGGRMAILTGDAVSAATGAGETPLARFVHRFDLKIERQAEYGGYEVLSARIPGRQERGAEDVRTISAAVDLPDGPIASIRLDPTPFLQSPVTIDELTYVDGKGSRAVDVCGDRALASMRTIRLGNREKCTFVFGDQANSGWIGPSALKNLGADPARRRLQLRMTGEFGDEVLIYLDTGKGYGSPIRVRPTPSAPGG